MAPLVVIGPPEIGPVVATLVTVPGPAGPVGPVAPPTPINQSLYGPPLPDVAVAFTTRVVPE
jgi:hypothetical protein